MIASGILGLAMLELGALLTLATSLLGGPPSCVILAGIAGNTAYDGVKAFWGLRERLVQPSLQNHDLQKALLQALVCGIQTVTRQHLKGLSLSEREQVEAWRKQVLQPLKQFQKEIEQDQFAWQVTEDMGLLLRANYKELSGLSQADLTSELQRFKAKYEDGFLQLGQLPQKFQAGVRRNWLAATYLYLSEAIKTQPRVAEMFQTNLLLDTQSRVKNLEVLTQELVNYFSNPQEFLGVVQPGVQIDITSLRSAIADLAADVQEVKETTAETLQISEQTLRELQDFRQDFTARQSSQPQFVSTIIEQSRPKVDRWLGRETEMTSIQAQFGRVNLIGITGLGGYGKTALASKVYDLASFATKIWVTLSQPYCFGDLGRELLRQLGIQIDEKAEDEQVATALVNQLAGAQALVVLDNLETLLTAEQGWLDSAYKAFLVKWLEYGQSSVLLITSRERPDLPLNNSYWQPTLQGLALEKGVQLLQELGIQGTVAELEAFVTQVDGHPLLLNLAAGLLKEELGNTPQLSSLKTIAPNLFEVDGLHRSDTDSNVQKLFEASLARLQPNLRQLVLSLSIYRLPFNHEAAAAQLPENSDIQITDQDLRQLARRSLLQELGQRDRQDKRLFSFQSLLLAYAQKNIRDVKSAHNRAIDYYTANLQEPDTWQTKTDLYEYFEAIHHYIKLEQYFSAKKTLEFCHEFLHFQGYNRHIVGLSVSIVNSWRPTNREGWLDYTWTCIALGHAYQSLALELWGEMVRQKPTQTQYSIFCFNQALSISRNIKYEQGEADSLHGLGCVYLFSQHDQAIDFFQQALAISRNIKYKQGEARNLNSLGCYYRNLRQYDQAIDFVLKALTISCEISDREEEAVSLTSLGHIFYHLCQYQRAADIYQQSAIICHNINYRHLEAYTLFYLSNCFNANEKTKKTKALEASHEIFHTLGLPLPSRIRAPYPKPLPPHLLDAYEGFLKKFEDFSKKIEDFSKKGVWQHMLYFVYIIILLPIAFFLLFLYVFLRIIQESWYFIFKKYPFD